MVKKMILLTPIFMAMVFNSFGSDVYDLAKAVGKRYERAAEGAYHGFYGSEDEEKGSITYLPVSVVEASINKLTTITNPDVVELTTNLAVEQINRLKEADDRKTLFKKLQDILLEQEKKFSTTDQKLSKAFSDAAKKSFLLLQ